MVLKRKKKPKSSRARATPALRADAQRNLDKLKTAALAAFRARGLDAPLEEIAQCAGVSAGTLYNRFANREALIDAVLPDVAAEGMRAVVESARVISDPWQRFAFFVQALCELQARDPALNDIVSGRYPEAERLAAVCEESLAHGLLFIEQAQSAGVLRADFVPDDLFVLLWSNANLIRATLGTAAPDAWRRSLGFLLDGLRAGSASVLREDPSSMRQTRRAILRIRASTRSK